MEDSPMKRSKSENLKSEEYMSYKFSGSGNVKFPNVRRAEKEDEMLLYSGAGGM